MDPKNNKFHQGNEVNMKKFIKKRCGWRPGCECYDKQYPRRRNRQGILDSSNKRIEAAMSSNELIDNCTMMEV